MGKLIDNFNRTIEYIRVSVTDRCNMKCIYCDTKDFNFISHEEILTYEEIFRILKVGARFGMKKVRITGGEPLLRKNLPYLISMISSIKKIETVALTTNGLLLKSYAAELKDAGLNHINISLDTLVASKFEMMTGVNKLSEILEGIEETKRVGIKNIKINAVVIKDLNSNEILDLIDFAYENRVVLRFIEYMPTTIDRDWYKHFLSKDEILNSIRSKFNIEDAQTLDISSPARYYNIIGRDQIIGIISPITHSFCNRCNRLRLTADGNIIACLLSKEKFNIKTPLRNGATDEELINIIKYAVRRKGEKGVGKISLMQEIGG